MPRISVNARLLRYGPVVGLLVLLPLLVLAALRLSSALHRQRDRGWSGVCIANLERIGAALAQYAEDNDDRTPPAERWAVVVAALAGGEQVLACPADPARGRTSYAFNARLDRGRLGDVLSPASVPMVYDSDKRLAGARDVSPELCSPPRHGSYNNALMADGSVRALGPYDRIVDARFAASVGEDIEVDQLPTYTGPTLLYASRQLGLRVEYPADWTYSEAQGKVVFRPPPGQGGATRAELRRVSHGGAATTDALPPTAQVMRHLRLDLAASAGDFPETCDATEYTDSGQRCLKLTVPGDPPVAVVLEAPEETWGEVAPALCLAVTTLQLVPIEPGADGAEQPH